MVVATLFAGGVEAPHGFALACQLDKGLGPEIDYMALRRKEDVRACAILGAEAEHLPLLEAPHRGYEDAEALFAPPHPDDPAAPALAQAVRALIATHTPSQVWAPRALGGHVDHVLVHCAVRDAMGGAAVRWWMDWPYADRPSPVDPQASTLDGLDWIEDGDEASARGRKADACAAYASQIGFQFGGEAALRERLAAQACERFAVRGAP